MQIDIKGQNQPRDQAGFRRKFSTIDHIYTLNQIIEKTNEYNLPLYVGFIEYEKAFDSVEHFAIFEALRKTNINETYVQILEKIYIGKQQPVCTSMTWCQRSSK